jgi:hypothetical protein
MMGIEATGIDTPLPSGGTVGWVAPTHPSPPPAATCGYHNGTEIGPHGPHRALPVLRLRGQDTAATTA